MNFGMIIYFLGCIIGLESILMIPSALISFVRGESCAAAFGVTIAAGLLLCLAMVIRKPRDRVIYAKEGFAITGLTWIVMSLIGAVPFYISGAIPSFVDSFFEVVSGFTTTGASILNDVEAIPSGLLFWRSFTHWIGGMGVLVFMMALMPIAGGTSIHVMRAESPGPSVEKLVPRIRTSAVILYGIYIALTVIEIILLKFGGLSWYDSFVHSFGTAGTGGFGVYADSVAHFNSVYVDVVITVFMLLFSLNFTIYFMILAKKFMQAFKNTELRIFLGIVAFSMIAVAINILPLYDSIWEALRYSSFQVASVISTTGYATTNFNLWPTFSKTLLVILMFIGACAGSTGGGLKVSRIIIAFKELGKGIRRMVHPRSVHTITVEGKKIEEETVHGVNIYITCFCIILAASTLLISYDGFSTETTFTAVVACLNNIGPGLDIVGPVGSYAAFSPVSKIVLTLDMLLGRLEIFPVMIMFMPSIWKRKNKS